MPQTQSSKLQSGKKMLQLLKGGPMHMARDQAQARVVDKIVEGTKIQDDERAKADSFAKEMGMGEHMQGTSVKRAFTRDGKDEFKSKRVPPPDEYTLASTQIIPRPVLRGLLEGCADASRFPQEKVRRSRWTGDLLYGSVNLEGLGTSAKIGRGLARRGGLTVDQLAIWLSHLANGGLDGFEEEVALDDIEFVDGIIAGLL